MTTAQLATRQMPLRTGAAARPRCTPTRLGQALQQLGAGLARGWTLFSTAVETAHSVESAPPHRARDLALAAWVEPSDR
jgi:hypothetical protein